MAFIDKRKRSREDADYCDVPLAKRINNLHLTNFEETFTPDYLQHHLHNHIVDMNTFAYEPGLGTAENQFYDPELSEAENPFYYLKNKLLHELHLERLKRCTV